jgi:AcrR family transcriptional regulator
MKKTELTKQAIIEAATKLLKEKSSVTIKEISEIAGVNIAAINYHFTDKQTLIKIIVKELLDKFQLIVDNFIEIEKTDSESLNKNLSDFISVFYDGVFENLGIIDYIMSPSNKEILETSGAYFQNQFAVDSAFSKKLLSKLGALCGLDSNDERLQVKYSILFSALCFPLILKINHSVTDTPPAVFADKSAIYKKMYVEELVNIIIRE